MTRIAIIPIDNRPVTYSLPKQIGEIDQDIEILLPPRNLLGDLRVQADSVSILKWLAGLKDIDVLIVSLDTIAYGGLIPSRFCNDSKKKIISRLDKLKKLIVIKRLNTYAMSSIMRISNNNINEEEKPYWSMFGKRIFEYSYAAHKAEETNAKEDIKRFKKAKNQIPDEILTDYLETRERNFEINLKYLEWAKEGVLKALVFSKDDCARYGINVQEANELERLSEGFDEIFVKTGADEIPLTLLSRAIIDDRMQDVRILPVFTCQQGIDNISNYEDISVYESVKGQIELAGASMVERDITIEDLKNREVIENTGANLVLIVNNFEEKQGELVLGKAADGEIAEYYIPDFNYFAADIKNANGGDNSFAKYILKHLPDEHFFGYAGWNTTGNSLGSAISCAVVKLGAENRDEEKFNRVQMIRFLDDWGYQANVREFLKLKHKSMDIDILTAAMKVFEEKLRKIFDIKEKIKYSLPWKRTFEIEVEIKEIKK